MSYMPITANASGQLLIAQINAALAAISGTAGVSSVTGTANQITASPTTGAVILSFPPSITASTVWTPSDASGAALSFTSVNARYTQIGSLVLCYGTLTYPSTVDTSAAKIGGLPVMVGNFTGNGGRFLCDVGLSAGAAGTLLASGTNFAITDLTGSAITNATLSLKSVQFQCFYMAA